ncbi:hypothetical protein RZS08_18945, partial [Arthrospira platensis SPKY1]|nr:hypothetical protein [Arthrospira platensis SPKY1]
MLVIFGASGDLTARKLIPALFNLSLDNLLPSTFAFIGFGRKPVADEDFRNEARSAIEEFSRRSLDPSVWGSVEQHTFYHAGNYTDRKAFEELAQRIAAIEKACGREMQLVFYISTPPSVFAPIIENLGATGLAKH